MKTFLKLTGIIAAVFALVGFIVMLAATGMNVKVSVLSGDISGAEAIFGTDNLKGNACGVIAFILAILALIAAIGMIVLSFVKPDLLKKFENLIWLAVAACLIVAAILLFFEKLAWCSANGINSDSYKYVHLQVGPILGGIFYLIAACFAAVNPVMKLLKK